MTVSKIFKFAASSGPHTPRTSRRSHGPDMEGRCRHRPEEMAGDAAGDASRERRTR
ncbi:unnamed protein product [Staurois parvus]|uniref:Uncharacterized protein n=1 Tax=Staurois parvus TaxID=386267 RepID=A0ABN9BDD6_9NEOB|nr:unnamed protein product [Staurois parvus]